jgi:hypothetical protein
VHDRFRHLARKSDRGELDVRAGVYLVLRVQVRIGDVLDVLDRISSPGFLDRSGGRGEDGERQEREEDGALQRVPFWQADTCLHGKERS